MKNVIICEGNTDLTLVQYLMERVYAWEHIKESEFKNFEEGTINAIRNAKLMKWFKQPNGSILCLLSSGGVSRIPEMLNSILDLNQLGTIIPFEQTGAIETFLLQALSKASEQNDPEQIDKVVIDQCIHFIDVIDCKGKYLKKRRERTKAKFDTAFVVMTPADAFGQRQNLLRSVPWEQFVLIQDSFKQLRKLSEV